MQTEKALVRGVIADIIVPHAAMEEPDLDRLSSEVKLLDESGVQAICIGGVLGGLIGATPAELSTVCATARRATQKALFAIVFPDASPECFEMVRAVNEAGADAILVGQPHYLAQPGSEALEDMFAQLRELTERPILVADCLPGSIFGAQTIRPLVEKRLVDGVLEAADMHVLVDLLCLGLNVPVYSGIEDLHYPSYVLGAQGVISNLASVFPAECTSLHGAVRSGEHARARKIHERLVRLWRGFNLGTEREARLRLALEMRARPVGRARSPYGRLSEQTAQQIHGIMQKEGVLAASS